MLRFLFCSLVSLVPLSLRAEEGGFSLAGYRYLGPHDILAVPGGTELLVLEKDRRQLRSVPLGEAGPGRSVRILPLPFEPERMNFFPDGKRLGIVGGGPRGELAVVDPTDWKITARIPVGHSPSDVSVFANGSECIAYVANRFGGDVSRVDLATGRETARWKAGREPISLRVTPDGRKLVVAGHLPEDESLNGGIAARIRIFNTETGTAREIPARSGAISLRDLCLTSDGRYAFVSGSIGHFEQIPTNVDGGWMNENALFVADVEKERFADVFYLDDYGHGGGNPWGVSLSDCGRFLVVAHAGSCEITLMNLKRLRRVLDGRGSDRSNNTATSAPERVAPDVMDEIPARMRIPLGLKGMRRAAMYGGSVYVAAYFEDSLGRIDMTITEPIKATRHFTNEADVFRIPERLSSEPDMSENAPLIYTPLEPCELSPMQGITFKRFAARLGPAPLWTTQRRGEMLFHDATVCRELWQSCTTCHPDVRSDCLNWDLLNDGMGNPKNTKSMILSHETPPNMAHGVRANAETAVRAGFHGILFTELPEDDFCAVDAYLSAQQPVPSPYLVDGELSPAARRGKLLFHDSRTGCSTCHPEPYYTDLRKHDVGTRSAIDTSAEFDTPVLVEVWRTAPYLHDGRYKTIRELIKEGKHVNTDGRLDKLTDREIDDLVEYVLSL